MTSLVVLIPTHGRPSLLGRTLRSVAACERPEGYAECLVIENGPLAGAKTVVDEVAAEHPHARFRYLDHERANKSAALNAALEGLADDPLCVFFDDDIVVDSGALVAYARAADQTEGGAFFGGGFDVEYEVEPADWVRPLLPASARGWDGTGPRPSCFLGFNWAAYAGDLHRAGGFDPAFGPGSPANATGQEYDMQQKLLGLGLTPVDVLDAWVTHRAPRGCTDPGWLLRRKYRVGTERGIRRKGDPIRELAKEARFAGRSALMLAKRTLLRDREGRLKALANLYNQAGFWREYLRGRSGPKDK